MAEIQNAADDPSSALGFALGDLSPDLVPQERGSGIEVAGVYYDEPKRFLIKSAHLSRADKRIFDVDTDEIVLISHHPGKNPYESLDPLGLAEDPPGGEWECISDVTATPPFQSFKIRPKKLSRHGRQYVKMADSDEVVMNVGKMSKLKTKSVRPHFAVGRGKDGDTVYKCVADMVGRTIAITNDRDELVAHVAKTKKAMIQTLAIGSGSTRTIDVAPGVDCSTILMVVCGIGQVGQHYVKDAFGNYVTDPLQDAAVDSAIGAVGDAVTGGDEDTEQVTGIFEAAEPEEEEPEPEEEEPEPEEEEPEPEEEEPEPEE